MSPPNRPWLTNAEVMARTGVTTAEFLDAMLVINGCSEAVRAAHRAKREGDWDAYERACEAMTDKELERECGL